MRLYKIVQQYIKRKIHADSPCFLTITLNRAKTDFKRSFWFQADIFLHSPGNYLSCCHVDLSPVWMLIFQYPSIASTQHNISYYFLFVTSFTHSNNASFTLRHLNATMTNKRKVVNIIPWLAQVHYRSSV